MLTPEKYLEYMKSLVPEADYDKLLKKYKSFVNFCASLEGKIDRKAQKEMSIEVLESCILDFQELLVNLKIDAGITTEPTQTTVTRESIESLIRSVNYHHEDSKVTCCFVTLKNGFKVTGTSGVVDKTKFDATIGEKYAYENAINKLWELEGYRLQWTLHEQKLQPMPDTAELTLSELPTKKRTKKNENNQ